MVTFVCEYCDLTLKKKQVDGHIRGRCRPGAMICIDCSGTFYGNDYKNHISCISEQDKHWGDYAKSKKTKQIEKEPKNQIKHSLAPKQQSKAKKLQKSEQNKPQNPKNTAQHPQHYSPTASKTQHISQQQQQQWKGWKTEIKQLIRESGQIQRKALLKKLRKVYIKKRKQQIGKQELQEIFIDKVQKVQNICVDTFYSIGGGD